MLPTVAFEDACILLISRAETFEESVRLCRRLQRARSPLSVVHVSRNGFV